MSSLGVCACKLCTGFSGTLNGFFRFGGQSDFLKGIGQVGGVGSRPQSELSTPKEVDVRGRGKFL